MLSIGTKAPDFTLPDQNGELRSLGDFAGSCGRWAISRGRR